MSWMTTQKKKGDFSKRTICSFAQFAVPGFWGVERSVRWWLYYGDAVNFLGVFDVRLAHRSLFNLGYGIGLFSMLCLKLQFYSLSATLAGLTQTNSLLFSYCCPSHLCHFIIVIVINLTTSTIRARQPYKKKTFWKPEQYCISLKIFRDI